MEDAVFSSSVSQCKKCSSDDDCVLPSLCDPFYHVCGSCLREAVNASAPFCSSKNFNTHEPESVGTTSSKTNNDSVSLGGNETESETGGGKPSKIRVSKAGIAFLSIIVILMAITCVFCVCRTVNRNPIPSF